MTVMKNIMIVSVLILLQMQSVYCAVALYCEEPDISMECFERRHYQLGYLDEVVIDGLQYMQDHSDLLSGMDATGIQYIEEEAKNNPEVKRFLDFRKRVLGYAEDMLPQFQKMHKERHNAFVALRDLLRRNSQCIEERTKQDPRVVMFLMFREIVRRDTIEMQPWFKKSSKKRHTDFVAVLDLLSKENAVLQDHSCKSVQDACTKVFESLKNSESLQKGQKRYITKVLAMPVDVPSGSTDRIREALRFYLQLIDERADLRSTCCGKLKTFWKEEKNCAEELDLVQKMREEANRISLLQNRKNCVLYGVHLIGCLVLFCDIYSYIFS